jgi:hypothetical protein
MFSIGPVDSPLKYSSQVHLGLDAKSYSAQALDDPAVTNRVVSAPAVHAQHVLPGSRRLAIDLINHTRRRRNKIVVWFLEVTAKQMVHGPA